MLNRMTLLDWAILAFPLLLALRGLSIGGVRVLLSGYFRGVLSLALAPFAGGIMHEIKPDLFSDISSGTGLPPLGGVLVGWAIAFVIVYLLLGIFRNIVAGILDASGPGRFLDRLFGVPAGLFVGTLLAMAIVVGPSLWVSSTMPSDRQPSALRDSVLLPIAVSYGRPLVDRVNEALRGLN